MVKLNEAFQFESDNGLHIQLQFDDLLLEELLLDADTGAGDEADPLSVNPFAEMTVSQARSRKSDWDELDLYTCWKEQSDNRFGCGSPAPSIPSSQRQYDGENSFEFCEQFAVR